MSVPEERFQGIGVAPGIARGVVFLHHPDDEEPPKRSIDDSEIAQEIVRFESALIATRAQILEMQQRIAEAIGAKDASIFDAHLLVVEDRTLIDEVLRNLEREKFNVEFIFAEVANRYARTLSEIDDPYLRERAFDIHDVTRRVVRNLLGRSTKTLGTIDLPQVVVAHNITPSDTATLNRQLVLGFATDVGEPDITHRDHGAFAQYSRGRGAERHLATAASGPAYFAGWDKWNRHSKPVGSDPVGIR